MSMTRREFLQVMAAAAAAGLPLSGRMAFASGAVDALYRPPRFGNVSLLHMTDSHAQLLPIHFREPSYNIGVGASKGQPPHLVGEHLLKHYGIRPGTREAHALTCLDYVAAARRYGKVGGYAHLATLVKQLRDSRPGALLLDGGDTWQGSATALWTKGQDMIDAQLQLGVDVMTGHWEFTYGVDRVNEVVHGDFKNKIDFVAQNIRTADFGDPVYPDYTMREVNGVQVAVIGQAFPYTPIAHPSRFVDGLSFGINDDHLQDVVHKARKEGAAVVVLLSHNGMDCDLKLASKVTGLDAIMGGHTHDGVPHPVKVKNAGGITLVTNAGSNGKFVGVLDFDVRGGTVHDFRYRLLPVFSDLLPADPDMQALIERHRKPYLDKLNESFAVSEGLLYRRGNFNGSFDQLIVDALIAVKDAQIALSPGFRWGTTLLPGESITRERLMDQTGITYPAVTVNEMTGERLKAVLEDVGDNLFNPDPYYQQGGDMVRVGGLTYTCDPAAKMGSRISDMRLHGKPIDAGKSYKVAGWASMTATEGDAIWDVVGNYLKAHQRIPALKPNVPKLIGEAHDPGIA